MGLGDEVIATALVKRAQRADARKVEIVDLAGARRSHTLWVNNPRIAQPGERGEFQRLVCCGGARPYIADKTATRWVWRDFECEPGEIYLDDSERVWRRDVPTGAVLIEPNIKPKASPNKAWDWGNWARLVQMRPNVNWAQLGNPITTRRLPGVRFVVSPSIRVAAAMMTKCKAAVLPEGGLHHVAAAMGLRAVVLYGGYISPKQTGYAMHRNIYDGGTPCGSRLPCEHCRAAMQAITPERVLKELEHIL